MDASRKAISAEPRKSDFSIIAKELASRIIGAVPMDAFFADSFCRVAALADSVLELHSVQATEQIVFSDKDKRRFWKRVDQLGPRPCAEAYPSIYGRCWVWTGNIREIGGYGSFQLSSKYRSRHIPAHKASLLIAGTIIPISKIVLHQCDNRRCVRPNHLKIGTRLENMAEMVARGRSKKRVGSKHHLTKFTEDDVISIRKYYASGESVSSIAKRVSATTECIRLLVFAFVFFVIAAFGIATGRISMIGAGLACVTLAELLGRGLR